MLLFGSTFWRTRYFWWNCDGTHDIHCLPLFTAGLTAVNVRACSMWCFVQHVQVLVGWGGVFLLFFFLLILEMQICQFDVNISNSHSEMQFTRRFDDVAREYVTSSNHCPVFHCRLSTGWLLSLVLHTVQSCMCMLQKYYHRLVHNHYNVLAPGTLTPFGLANVHVTLRLKEKAARTSPAGFTAATCLPDQGVTQPYQPLATIKEKSDTADCLVHAN